MIIGVEGTGTNHIQDAFGTKLLIILVKLLIIFLRSYNFSKSLDKQEVHVTNTESK